MQYGAFDVAQLISEITTADVSNADSQITFD